MEIPETTISVALYIYLYMHQQTQCLSWTFSYIISFQYVKKSVKALSHALPGTG